MVLNLDTETPAERKIEMSKEKKLTRGCVVFMKASSGFFGYGNEQCVSSVCEELGTVSLFGHNQHYKIYDIDRITEYPPSQAEIEELKEQLAAANHDYNELMKERTDYVAENKRLLEALNNLSKWAAAIHWNRKKNTQDWMNGLKQRIEIAEQALKGK